MTSSELTLFIEGCGPVCKKVLSPPAAARASGAADGAPRPQRHIATLWDRCSAVTALLEPTYDAIFTQLRASPVVGVDQTGWPDLEDTSLPPWQMWCVTAPELVYHRICDDKSARTFTSLLGDYRGWVVADALGTHKAGTRGCDGVRLAACWAHVLRRFRDAVVDFPDAQMMLA